MSTEKKVIATDKNGIESTANLSSSCKARYEKNKYSETLCISKELTDSTDSGDTSIKDAYQLLLSLQDNLKSISLDTTDNLIQKINISADNIGKIAYKISDKPIYAQDGTKTYGVFEELEIINLLS